MILIIFPLITIFVRKFNLKSALVGKMHKNKRMFLNTILEALRGIRKSKLLQQKKKNGKNLVGTIKECLNWLKD